jgi:hypothetical protein
MLVLILVLAGCREAPEREPAVAIDTLASGVVSVRNGDGGAWTVDSAWSVTPAGRIGAVAGEGADVFGAIGALTIDALGRIWVYDRQASELRVFDEHGAHVRTVGRSGEGPGEFSEVVGLLWSPEGNLWTVDQRAGRVSVFDSAGVFLTSHRLTGTSFHSRWPGIIDRNGHFYDVEREFRTQKTSLIRRDHDFLARDTLTVPMHPSGPPSTCQTSGSGAACANIPYAGTVAWALTSDGGMWTALTDQYHLTRLGPSGDTLRIVSKPFEPQPLEGAERDSVQLPMLFGEPIDRSLLPAVKPVIAELIVDDEENVWVVRAESPGDSSTIDILDPRGVYRGTLTLPVAVARRPVVVRGGELATVVRDSLGVNYVARFRIRKP